MLSEMRDSPKTISQQVKSSGPCLGPLALYYPASLTIWGLQALTPTCASWQNGAWVAEWEVRAWVSEAVFCYQVSLPRYQRTGTVFIICTEEHSLATVPRG